MEPIGTLKVAAVHAAPIYMDKKATLDKVIDLIAQAGSQSVRLLVFPEVFVPGFPYFINCYNGEQMSGAIAKYIDQSVVVGENGEDIPELLSACREHGVAISLGISERVKHGHTLFNAQLNIDSTGRFLGVHRKLQPTYIERVLWAQGSGHTLRTYVEAEGYNLGGLCCWEHTMNGARQALIEQREHVHAGAWPSLNTRGFEKIANVQIEAMMKNHALTAQVFAITASNYVDEVCLDWLRENIGEQDILKAGGGWSAIIHPFCSFVAGPHTGSEENMLIADINLADITKCKVWIDASGHFSRRDILTFSVDKTPKWEDDVKVAGS